MILITGEIMKKVRKTKMGKKNKKRDDYWGVNTGEQMAYVESLNDLNNLCKPEKKIYNDNAIFNMAGIDRETDINDFDNRDVDDIVRNVVNISSTRREEEDNSNRSLMSMNISDNNSDDNDYDDYWLNVSNSSAPEAANISISESAPDKYEDPDVYPSGAPFAKVRQIFIYLSSISKYNHNNGKKSDGKPVLCRRNGVYTEQ